MKQHVEETRQSRVSITVALSTLMVTVSVLLAGMLVYFGYQRNHDAALLAAEEVLAAVSQQIDDRLLTMVRPIVGIAKLAPILAPIGIQQDGPEPSYQAYLTEVVNHFAQVSSVFFGLADGSFYQVATLDGYSQGYRERLGVPEQAATARSQVAHPMGAAPQRTIQYFDTQGEALSEPAVEATTFDPRERPWYALAMASDRVVGTAPYRFASSGDLGVTVARRLPGATTGVLGVDITLVDLRRFLTAQKPTEDSSLYLFTDAGEVLAWATADPDPLPEPASTATTDTLPGLSDFRDPFADMLDQSLREDAEPPLLLEQDGRTFAIRRTHLTGPLGTSLYVGISVPADHFTGPIIALGRNSAAVSVLFIVAMVPLITLVSRTFSRPLHKLASEADAIRDFNLDNPVEVRTKIREIQALSTSMDRMKSGLRTFGVYVPRDLVKQMMARSSPPRLGGERRSVTILFSDIAGFTPIADGLEPEVVMQRMSDYFETVTAALRAHAGTIDKFMGDAVMAMWNALVDDPDHAVSGCRGVLAAHAAVDELNARLVAQGLAPMPTRFGLHTGEAVVGNVGSSERMNFTALGATVNLAARLEPLNKVYGTRILVSQQVADTVREAFWLRSVAIVKPKGVTQPLRVHELLSERDGTTAYAWVDAWERGFDAFASGDMDAASQFLEKLSETLADDPVRQRLLARIGERETAAGGTAWDPVDYF